MSDTPQGPGWWQASDQKWYPPETQPGAPGAVPQPGTPPQPGAVPQPGTPPQPGFAPGVPPAPGPAAGGKANGKAIASLVLGIASIVVCYLGFIPGVIAIVLGLKARKEVEASGGQESGSGMALAGIITGAVGLLWLFSIVAIILIATLGESTDGTTFNSLGG